MFYKNNHHTFKSQRRMRGIVLMLVYEGRDTFNSEVKNLSRI